MIYKLNEKQNFLKRTRFNNSFNLIIHNLITKYNIYLLVCRVFQNTSSSVWFQLLQILIRDWRKDELVKYINYKMLFTIENLVITWKSIMIH